MTSFKWWVRFRILALVVLGAMLIGLPWLKTALPSEWAVDPSWARLFGVGLIFIALAYLPSGVAPETQMSGNLFAVFGPVLPVALLIWLAVSSGAPAIMAIATFELFFALVIGWTFRRGYIQQLMLKP